MSIFLLPVNAVMASADEQTPDNEEVAETMNEEESEEEPEASVEDVDTEEPAEAEDTEDTENTASNEPAQASMQQVGETETSGGEAEPANAPAAASAQAQIGSEDDEGAGDSESNGDEEEDSNGDNGEDAPMPPPPPVPAPEEPELVVHPIEPYAEVISGTANLNAQVIVFYPGTEGSISTSVDGDGNWNIVNTNNNDRHFTPGSSVPVELQLEDGGIFEYTIPVEDIPAEEEPAPEETVILADEYEPEQTGASFNIEFTEADEINYPDETEVVSNFWELPQGTQLEYTNILDLGQTGEITEEMVNMAVTYPDGSSDELEPTLATVIPAQIDTPQPENSDESIETEAGSSSGVVSSGEEEQPNEEVNQNVAEDFVNDEVNSSGVSAPDLLPKTGTSNHTHVIGLTVLSIGLGLIIIERSTRKQN